jgi:hypothetical protein
MLCLLLQRDVAGSFHLALLLPVLNCVYMGMQATASEALVFTIYRWRKLCVHIGARFCT